MAACFDRNQTWWQAFKLTTESRNSRRQKPASDDLRLFIQNAEVALSVAKIDPNRHSPSGSSFSKTNQRSNVSVLWHSRSPVLALNACMSGSLLQRSSPPFSSHLDGRSRRQAQSLLAGRHRLLIPKIG